MDRLPATRSSRWFRLMLVYAVVLSGLLVLNRFIVVGETLQIGIVFRFILLGFVLALVANGFGWLGARYVWLLTTLGIVFGLIVMYYYSTRNMTGWEDLFSFLGFMQGTIIGFALGVVVELILYLGRRSKKK
jgi:hypothetical protein